MNFRMPVAQDGPAITALIAACPPLDGNSSYCNLLQCTHFADSCLVAERDGRIVGWVSGYRLPADPSRLFIWQVAVAAQARGAKLAQRMIAALLERPSVAGVTHLITTITPDNAASWALFRGIAARLSTDLTKTPLFERNAHFVGAHETEWQATIGPFALPSKASQ